MTDHEVRESLFPAFNRLVEKNEGLISDCRLVQAMLCDTTEIDTEPDNLRREMEIISELSRKAIYENAGTIQNQSEFQERNNRYLSRHRQTMEQAEVRKGANLNELPSPKYDTNLYRT